METAVIPPFTDALPEADWNAKLEAARAEELAAKQAAEDAESAKLEAERAEQREREKQEALAARQAELARVRDARGGHMF